MLFFYGDGGNGKSLLLRLLQARYCRRLNAADWQRLQALTDDRTLVDRGRRNRCAFRPTWL